jgi:prevent-host-death family protein
MREVGAFEAKNKLSELLDLAERGEEIVITRHGKAVARLVPPRGTANRDEARAAMERVRQRAKAENHGLFDWAEWKTYVNEGRR